MNISTILVVGFAATLAAGLAGTYYIGKYMLVSGLEIMAEENRKAAQALAKPQ